MTLDNDILNLLRSLHVKLTDASLTVSTAESCTSGLLAYLLTVCPGSSTYYLGGFATYSNELKQKCLDVREATLNKCGAVSEEVVKQMASGCLRTTNASYALATTGIAGPDGGTPSKPVGTVWTGLAWQSGNTVICDAECLHLDGSREEIRLNSAITLLKKLEVKVSS